MTHNVEASARSRSGTQIPKPGTIRVIGIGNTLAGDDGLGVRAVQSLGAEADHDAAVEFVDGGTLGLYLLDDIVSSDGVILIDAVRMGERPGTVRVFEGAAMAEFVCSSVPRTAHEVGLADLIHAVNLLDGMPRRSALIGVEPEACTWCGELSDAALGALQDINLACRTILRRWRQTPGSRAPFGVNRPGAGRE